MMINKRIDTWPFRIGGTEHGMQWLDFEIRFSRPKSISVDDGADAFEFMAYPDTITAKKKGIGLPKECDLQAETLKELRQKIIEFCHALDTVGWKKVIVVGVRGVDPTKSYEQTEVVQFYYEQCWQCVSTTEWFRREDLYNWLDKTAILHGRFSDEQIFVYDYDSTLEKALDKLDGMFGALAQLLHQTLSPEYITKFTELMSYDRVRLGLGLGS